MRLTPDDIKNPKNKSGYDYVAVTHGNPGNGPSSHAGGATRYQASKGAKGRSGVGSTWRGPRRKTAVEAAQDYCDYINGDPALLSAALKRVGKTRTPRDPMNDDEVKHALGVLRDARAQRRGRQGYVYLIGDGTAVKVGYSVNPEARVAELQTGNPRELHLLATMEGTEADERALHMKYIQDNILLEWFNASRGLYEEFGLEVVDTPSGA